MNSAFSSAIGYAGLFCEKCGNVDSIIIQFLMIMFFPLFIVVMPWSPQENHCWREKLFDAQYVHLVKLSWFFSGQGRACFVQLAGGSVPAGFNFWNCSCIIQKQTSFNSLCFCENCQVLGVKPEDYKNNDAATKKKNQAADNIEMDFKIISSLFCKNTCLHNNHDD